MQRVMREIAQAKKHFSKLPFFQFLRTHAVTPINRLAFYPCMAPFILAFSDLNRFLLSDEAARDPRRRFMAARAFEDDPRWRSYLDDFTKLGFDKLGSTSSVLRLMFRDTTRVGRMLGTRLAQLLHGASIIEQLVIVAAIEEAGEVMFDATAKLASEIETSSGLQLCYLGKFRFTLDGGHELRDGDRQLFEAVEIDSNLRGRCLELAFLVFDEFADWTNELLTFAMAEIARQRLAREERQAPATESNYSPPPAIPQSAVSASPPRMPR